MDATANEDSENKHVVHPYKFRRNVISHFVLVVIL